jgi:hypothetical protein
MVEYTYLELFLFCTSVIGLAFSLKYREEARSHHRFISALLEDKNIREKVFEQADMAFEQARKEGIL